MCECPLRLTAVILTSLGLAIMFGIRMNIGITIVRMVKRGSGNSSNTTEIKGPCGYSTVPEKDFKEGDYEWSNKLQGVILSAYYWGYIVGLFPGAKAAELISLKWVWFGCVFISMVGSFITPLSADIHYGALIAVRVMQGAVGGALVAAMPLIVGRWVPVHERNTMSGITFSGAMFGMVASTIATGFIEVHFGWRTVFYVMGCVCVPYLTLWTIFLADYPEKSKLMKPKELELILTSLGDVQGAYKRKVVTHWKKILTSKPFWGLFITHGFANWVGYFLVTSIAIYMDKVFHLDLDHIAIIIAAGGTLSWIFSIVLGRILDYLRKNKNVSQTTNKRIATLVAYGPIAIMLFALAFVGCHTALGVTFCILVNMAYGGTYCGWLSNHVDIGPKIASTLMACTNLSGTTAGILVPLFVGYIIGDGLDINSWMIIYLVTCGSACIVIVVYILTCSGENQNYYDEVDVTT